MATCNVSASEAAQLALSLVSGDPWTTDCIDRLDWGSLLGDPQGGLVGAMGNPLGCFDNSTWGITKSVCDQYCSIGQMPISARFDWLDFWQGFNSYLLPWIALTAQLPFQTGGFVNDLMSGILAVGCPTLVTFSLGITISNRRWAKRRLNRLYVKARDHPATSKEWLLTRIASMKFLLEEAQQEPLRINDRNDFEHFATLESESENWKKLLKRLKLTRRGLTASLVAQNLVAIIAWTITVVASSYANGTLTQTAAGVLWMWLTPVVCGWVAVGVQTGAQSVEEALDDAFESHENLNAPIGPCWEPIRANSVILGQPEQKEGSWLDRALDTPGDGLRKGPLYNYARAPTWWKFARKMEKTADRMLESLQSSAEKPPPKGYIVSEKNATVSVTRIVQQDREVHAYPPLRKFLTDGQWRLVWPAIMALFVQLGNTFGAFVMAYQTLPIGLGCNSGGYVLYGIGSTIAFICLVVSAILSHITQFHRERHQCMATFRLRMLSLLAVTTRMTGKFIAVLNCIWLVMSTLFELGGLYNTCYCYSSALGLGSQAWVVMWARQTVLTEDAGNWWIAGVSIATVVCIGSMIFFVSLSLQGRSRRSRAS